MRVTVENRKYKYDMFSAPLPVSLDFGLSFFILSLAILTISTASTHTHTHTTGANSRVLWSFYTCSKIRRLDLKLCILRGCRVGGGD
jgi:hypothetical protein